MKKRVFDKMNYLIGQLRANYQDINIHAIKSSQHTGSSKRRVLQLDIPMTYTMGMQTSPLHSDALVVEVLEQVQCRVVPVLDERALGCLLQLCTHHFRYMMKRLRDQYNEWINLLVSPLIAYRGSALPV